MEDFRTLGIHFLDSLFQCLGLGPHLWRQISTPKKAVSMEEETRALFPSQMNVLFFNGQVFGSLDGPTVDVTLFDHVIR